MGRLVRLALCLVVAVSIWFGPAVASTGPGSTCTYYVRADFIPIGGEQAANGCTPETAFRRIGDAAAQLKNPGETVCVGPGVYREGNIDPKWSGTPMHPIELRADPTGILTGDPSGEVRIVMPGDAPEQTVGFLVLGRHDLIIDGFILSGFTDAAIQVRSTVPGFGSNATTANSRDITLRNNLVTDSIKTGIDVSAEGMVVVESNTVLGSGDTGISIQSCVDAMPPPAPGDPRLLPKCSAGPSDTVTAVVSNNHSGSNGAHGVFLKNGENAVVQNNVVFSNGASGITLRSVSDALIVNNLVYQNAQQGIGIGTAGLGSPNATVLNNTLYQNDGWGLSIGSAGGASPGATVLDNIFQANGTPAGQTGAIGVAKEDDRHPSPCGYVAGFNVLFANNFAYGPDTPSNVYDVAANPFFVDPDGADNVLGGDGYVDDDFRLRQDRTGRSPAVDAGHAPISETGLTGGTSADKADTGIVDAGFHYGADPSQVIAVPTPFMPVYVRKGGPGTNNGKTPADALSTLKAGALRARAGATVIVGPGEYLECDVGPPPNQGRATFVADARGEATGGAPGAVVIDAFPCGAQGSGFNIQSSCYARVEGFQLRGAPDAGIQIEGSDWAEVRDNTTFFNRLGILVDNADDVQVVNNLVYQNTSPGGDQRRGGGIQVGGTCLGTSCDETGSKRALVQNNTCWENGVNGILIGAGQGVSSLATVRYNILQSNGENGIQVGSNSTTAISSRSGVRRSLAFQPQRRRLRSRHAARLR